MRYTLQLSGPPARDYSERFRLAAETCQRLLAAMGFEVVPDCAGMAYIVTKGDRFYGGPATRQEVAMWAALRAIERGEVS